MGKTRIFVITLIVTSLMLVTGVVNWASAGEEDLVALAKQEGKLVVYSSYPVASLSVLIDAFETKYGIDAEYYRGGSTKVVEKYLAEVEARSVYADIINPSDLTPMVQFVREGLLTPYLSPEYENYNPKWYDPEGHWFISVVNLINVMYNTDCITADEAPETWLDLLNPLWKGKMTIGDATAGGTDYMWYYVMRKTYGSTFHKMLALLEPTILVGSSTMAQGVLAGEYCVCGEMLHYRVWGILQDSPDAPVGQSWPSPVPVAVRVAGITKDAPHPNAAKLFMNFLASEEGQQIGTLTGSFSPRPGIETPGLPNVEELDTYLIGPDELDEFVRMREELNREYEDIYRGG